MNTLIYAYLREENSKDSNYNEALSKFLTDIYNDQNTKIEFLKDDVVRLEGGYSHVKDDAIYHIARRYHYFNENGGYSLELYLDIVQKGW